jgi:hypothetical protein
MSAETQRTCPSCGNELSGAIEFCPVCMLRKGLAGAIWAVTGTFTMQYPAFLTTIIMPEIEKRWGEIKMRFAVCEFDQPAFSGGSPTPFNVPLKYFWN